MNWPVFAEESPDFDYRHSGGTEDAYRGSASGHRSCGPADKSCAGRVIRKSWWFALRAGKPVSIPTVPSMSGVQRYGAVRSHGSNANWISRHAWAAPFWRLWCSARARWRRLNQDLSRSNRELEEFVYTASHDLKSPLRGIATYAQMVLRTSGDELTGKDRERIQSIVQLANRMDGTPAFLRRSRRKRASQFPHRTSCCAIMRGKDKPPLIETTVLLRRRRLCSHTCVRILVITNAPVCSRHFDAALSTGKTAPAAAPATQSKAPAHCSRLRCR